MSYFRRKPPLIRKRGRQSQRSSLWSVFPFLSNYVTNRSRSELGGRTRNLQWLQVGVCSRLARIMRSMVAS